MLVIYGSERRSGSVFRFNASELLFPKGSSRGFLRGDLGIDQLPHGSVGEIEGADSNNPGDS